MIDFLISWFTDFYDIIKAIVVFLYEVLKNLPDLISKLIDLFTGSNTEFFQWVFAKIIELVVLAYFTLMTYLVPFVWGIASIIVKDIYDAAEIQSYASMMPDWMRGIFSTLGIFQAIDIIITAHITRWIFKMIPFVGR